MLFIGFTMHIEARLYHASKIVSAVTPTRAKSRAQLSSHFCSNMSEILQIGRGIDFTGAKQGILTIGGRLVIKLENLKVFSSPILRICEDSLK